jgi:hypothetical protein
MTPALLHILRHSIGLDDKGNGREYRNHFATDPDSPDGRLCQELCAAGLMTDYGAPALWGGMHCYKVTDEGMVVARLKTQDSTEQQSGECVADADAHNARAIYWLPVTRELPDDGITVPVHTPKDDEPVFLGFLDGEIWRNVNAEQIEVTHWADLPEPPTP